MRVLKITAALFGAVSVWMFAAAAQAQTPLDDALTLLETDPPAALQALEVLVARNEIEAMNAVAAVINNPPDGVEADPERALRLWKLAVEGGSSAARLNLGTQLLLNDDASDDAQALALLNAIEGEDLRLHSAYPMARAYLFGQGVERDLERGSRLMITAVELTPTNIDAQFLLGRAYQNGWGIAADPTAAFRHMKAAADGGDPRAQWNVGMMLLNGDGVAQNPVVARQYVRQSAEGGHIDGMISMAVMLALGQGGAVDGAGSRRWYARAADAGSAHALRGLGMMLLIGEGGPADPVTGAAYLDLAAKAGDEFAPQLQQRLAAQIATLDPAAVEAAKGRWLREHPAPR